MTTDNRPIGVRSGSSDDRITGRNLLLGRCAILHAAILGRKSWFMRNPYDTSLVLVEDYELWLRAYSKSDFNIHVLREHLYYYREEGNATIHKMIPAYANQLCLLKRYGYLGFSRLGAILMMLKWHAKSSIVRVLSACNRMDLLIKNRNNSIVAAQLNYFNHEIQQISRTVVPGID